MTLTPHIHLYQHRGNVLQSAPAAEPVTADQLRDYLRETAASLPDSEANDLIEEARQYIEDQSGIAMITQTWLMAIDRWPTQREPWWDGVRQGHINILHGAANASSVKLPRYPLQSISGVNVYDEAGNATAVDVGATFDVDVYQSPGRMTIKSGAAWPIATRANNAIEITYVSGYGDAAADVPAPLRRAVKQLAGYLYSHRGDGCDVGMAYDESGAAGIVATYKVMEI